MLWTLGIWGSRIRNILADDELVGGERIVSLGVALALLIAAVATGVALLQRAPWERVALLTLVVLGIARFTIRGPFILVSDEWETAFKVVHTILWMVTVILSLVAWREHRSAQAR